MIRAWGFSGVSNQAMAASPALYRSEGFLEDLDLMPAPQPVRRAAAAGGGHLAAWPTWLLAAPGMAAAALGMAAMLKLPPN